MMINNPAKTRPPQLFQKILPRKRIAHILDTASMGEAVCLVAPYGYGKTTAVLSWLREREQRAAWLSLEQTDHNAAAFMESLAAALLPFAVAPGDIDFLSTLPCTGDTRAFLLDAASRMAAGNIPVDTLVLDNFHFIRDAKLLRDIKDFIYPLLGHMRVIIISRAMLAPTFNDLLLKRHVCLITIQELSFSLEEVTEYFSMNEHLVAHENLAHIYDETEGWPAALNVILTISREGPVEYGEDARAYVMGFFETEIWNGLDDAVKDFLLRTSVLDRLTPTACHALTGIGASLPILTWLFTNGLFVSRLERDTYQYHRVFSDFLQDKLKDSHIAEQELYQKAAWWHFERNEFEQSFRCFFKARELYGLSRVFHVLTAASMGIEAFLELTSCITSLDVNDLKPYPIILARMALIQYLLGDIEEMQRLYAIFQEWVEPGELPVSAEDYGEYLWEAGWMNYINPAVEVLGNKQHEEWSNYKEYTPYLKPLHALRFSTLRFPSAIRGIRDYSPSLSSIDEFVEQNEASGRSIIRGEYALYEMELIRAEYAYETENYRQAEQLLRKIMPEIADQKISSLYFVCTVLLVKLARAIHGSKEIDKLTNRLESIIMENGDAFLLPNFHAFQQRNWLLAGQAGFIDVFEQENKKYASKPYYYLLYRHFAYVRALLSTENYREALLILGNLEILCRKYKRTIDMMEVNSLRSIALFRLGDEEGACRSLMDAVKAAKPYGFIRIFSDDARDIWPILELVKKQLNDSYIKNIIISCKKTLARTGIKLPHNHDELTRTELKVLKSLQANMSYQEIALEHDIKLSTVKSHAHSIYSKLQVANRMSAVITAQNAGILE